ncbi:MAG: cytochrome c oxidase subunit II [Haloferacaceae archaeon]
MKRTRLGLVAVLSAVTMALFASPVAAQTTTTDGLITSLNLDLLYLAIPIVVVTEVVLFYAVWRFRKSDEPKPTQENRRLEITWTIATAIILLFVGVASYGVLAQPDVAHAEQDPIAPDDDDVVVEASAYQWGWDMSYPEEDVEAEDSRIVVPADTDIYFLVETQDVIHGFHVPEMGLKVDAIPGMTNTVQTHTLEEGTYQGYCSEFCGTAHSQMYFTVEVVSEEDYEQHIDDLREEQSE